MSEYHTEGEYDVVGDSDVVGRPFGRFPPRLPAQQLSQSFNPALLRPGVIRPISPMPQSASTSTSTISESRVREIVADELRVRFPAGRIPAPPGPDALLPMGLGRAVLTPTVTSVTLIARPQRAFRGERLVLSLAPDGGATSADVANVSLDSFRIGDAEQLVGGGALPASIFASDAFGVRLLLSGCTAGVDVVLRLSIPALGSGTITITGAIIGRGDPVPGAV